ncbi:hypothetical protein DPMN_072413 [Dreissena polymorpha]|uniref:Uncharacterized protein n=1 Tax=Dreissena polymorpha TaxID=45954 RepID=A0A9D3Z8M8_DREPO|nr:hypothetical protein DPMN_072413 [Dreissena polymorpha]
MCWGTHYLPSTPPHIDSDLYLSWSTFSVGMMRKTIAKMVAEADKEKNRVSLDEMKTIVNSLLRSKRPKDSYMYM